jgi:UDP-N-acetylmuramoyl-tripeptide--D-alanyl-D-alanine ligase
MSLLKSLEAFLGRSTQRAIQREKPLIIAVVGSVGKSSTKQAIGAVLSVNEGEDKARISAKSYNNDLGVPLTVFGKPAPGRSLSRWLDLLWTAWATARGWKRIGSRLIVLEMGADHPGDLERLLKIAPPSIGVVSAITPEDTTLAPAHTANYPSIDALADENALLVKAIGPEGTVILNADDKRAFALRHETRAHVLTFGETDAADVRILQTKTTAEPGDYGARPTGIEVTLESLNCLLKLRIPSVFGRPIAYALAAAIAVGVSLDIPFENMEGISSAIEPMKGRTRIIPGIKHTTLLDDTYNASPIAVLSALRDLANLPLEPRQRRVACLGEMRELGPESQTLHRMVGAEAAKLGIDLLVSCGTLAHAMAEGARANGMKEEQVIVFDDTPEAGKFLQDWIRPGDIVLAKASEGQRDSKGVRMERVIKELMAEPQRASELLVRQEDAWMTRK